MPVADGDPPFTDPDFLAWGSWDSVRAAVAGVGDRHLDVIIPTAQLVRVFVVDGVAHRDPEYACVLFEALDEHAQSDVFSTTVGAVSGLLKICAKYGVPIAAIRDHYLHRGSSDLHRATIAMLSAPEEPSEDGSSTAFERVVEEGHLRPIDALLAAVLALRWTSDALLDEPGHTRFRSLIRDAVETIVAAEGTA